MNTERKSVGIFPINSNKKILLHLRDNKPEIDCPGYWSMIGGEIDKGETDLKAIKREVEEEIGDIVKNIEKVGEIFVRKSDIILKNTQVSLFKGYIKSQSNKIKINEGQKVDFFDLKQLTTLRMFPQVRKFIFDNTEKIFN